MFHHFTVETNTYKLLQTIFQINFVKEQFALAGGTSLALQLGSRTSVDLDFFTPIPFDTAYLEQTLTIEFGENFKLVNRGKSMFFCYINGIKCDFVHEPARLLSPFQTYDEILVYTVKDIAAMKLHTICGRGKKKDFFDIYSLLENYQWDVLVKWFTEKYNEEQQFFLLRSIQYFEDAESDPDINAFPPYTNNWNEIKQIILKKVSESFK